MESIDSVESQSHLDPTPRLRKLQGLNELNRLNQTPGISW